MYGWQNKKKINNVKKQEIISCVFNKAINLLHFEAYIPGCDHCVTIVKLQKYLQHIRKGINKLKREKCMILQLTFRLKN